MARIIRANSTIVLPPGVRRSFRYEQLTECTFPVALALLEGGIVGVIAAKVYHVSPAVLALISAAPMFGNLSSFLWNQLANARPKVAFANIMQALVITCVLAVALAPVNDTGAIVLVSSMVISRVLIAGVITARSVVWSLNYARTVRARATARLQMIASLITVAVSSSVGPLLDANPLNFPWVYLAGAAISCVGIVFFSRVNVVGELRQRVRERQAVSAKSGSVGFFRILRDDRYYARYQLSMFAAGFANMLVEAPLIRLVTIELQASYTLSILIIMVIPFAISLLTLPVWARYLDRVHVARFRARQGILWVVSLGLLCWGAFAGSLELLVAARVVQGVARGGGTLAWQLGHNDFARTEQLSAYMGVHVTLTGVRGAIAPFLGMALYVGWSGWWPVDGVGAALFAIAACISLVSTFGFARLYRAMVLADEEANPQADTAVNTSSARTATE